MTLSTEAQTQLIVKPFTNQLAGYQRAKLGYLSNESPQEFKLYLFLKRQLCLTFYTLLALPDLERFSG